jgi:hypothetical protein
VTERAIRNAGWLHLFVSVLILALFTASLACAVRCVGASCLQKSRQAEAARIPPCHQDNSSDAPSESCTPAVLIAVNTDLTVKTATMGPVPSPSVEIVDTSDLFPIHVFAGPAMQEGASPPRSPDLVFSVVRRI